MKHHTLWSMGGAIVLVSVGTLTVTSLAQQETPRPGERRPAEPPSRGEALPHPVVETHDLMNLFNKPAYLQLEAALTKEQMNSDDWTTVSNNAYRVAEVANLIAIREDAAKHRQWRHHAEALQQSAMQLAMAVDSRDETEARRKYRTMVSNCNACHQAAAPNVAPVLETRRGEGDRPERERPAPERPAPEHPETPR